MRQQRKLRTLYWVAGTILAIAVLTGLAHEARADSRDEIGVNIGHWGHHWLSKDITNEQHAMVLLRYNQWLVGRAYNSYRQPGFDGELLVLGVVKEWQISDYLNRYRGHWRLKGSAGVNYGYTDWYGHDPEGDKKWLPYIAGGPFYRQLMFPEKSAAYWEAGFIQFGDDTIPSIGFGTKF